MPKLFTEKAKFDPANRAENILDHVLDETSEITQERKAQEVSVKDALESEQVVDTVSQRIQPRVLFVTRDQTAFDTDSPLQHYFKSLSGVFDEVHVLVVQVGKRSTKTTRIAKNAWIYPAPAKYFLWQPFTAFSVAKRQLRFAEGFRPDIIVALDAFESGISAYFIAKKYKRALQVHVTEDYLIDTFEKQEEVNKWRLRFARYVVKRTKSIRTDSAVIQAKLQKCYPKKKNIFLLPRFFDIKNIVARADKEVQEKKYPQFSFTVLYIGSLTHKSTLFRAIDATRRLLATPSIGFIIIGDGPAKAEFQERSKILGVDRQTIFLSKADDLVGHMLSADVLICTDTTSESDEVVIKSAAAKLPIVMARNQLRDDLFTDGEDAFLCPPEDTAAFATKLMKFLNTNTLRTQFAQNAQDVVTTRIEESITSYHQSLRASIESVLYTDQDQAPEPTPATPKSKKAKQKKENTNPKKSQKNNKNKTPKNTIKMHMPEV